MQNKAATDFGADNLVGTSDDKNLTFWQVAPAFVGKDAIVHSNCGSNVSVTCTPRYKALELSLSKRMSNHWQMQGSYVWISHFSLFGAGILSRVPAFFC